jgi:hypothetical protein
MQNTHTSELMTAKDHQIAELKRIVSLLNDSLSECFEFVQDVEFNNPSHKTSEIIERADEAMFQASEAIK